ncbi:ISL3 family transposase, partial [Massilimicrobiota timonensis]|nr:ISL3 family transposase [Massilimicrobiota timonensis]
MTDRVKDYSVKHINHSILTNKKCIINYRARRYRCPKCHKTFMESNPFTV